ncbi:hypothetical protein LZ30DRAFT_207127 [Colletotrichum cereale]|nr:hypothetical protein LZ30DRAFT_207127 [Colletotrichum cereale]
MCTRNPPQVASHDCRISSKQIRSPSIIFPYIDGPKTEGRRTKANFEVVVVSSRIRKRSTRINQTVRHDEDFRVFQKHATGKERIPASICRQKENGALEKNKTR